MSLLGDGLAALAVPLLVLDLTRSPVASGLAAGAVTVGYLLVGLPAGVLADRLDPWPVMMAMDVARALLFAALSALFAAGLLTVWLVLSIAVAVGACTVFFETSLVIAVRDLFTGARLARANSVLELASQASLIAGPMLVGALAAAGSLGPALLADMATFLVSLLSLAAWRRRNGARGLRNGAGTAAGGAGGAVGGGKGAGAAPRPGVLAEFRAGLRYLASVRLLVVLTAVQVVVNLCLAVERLIVYFARDTLALGPGAVGVVMAAGGAGGVAGALIAARLAALTGETRAVLAAVIAAGAAVAAMSAARSPATLGLANFGYAAAITVASLVNRTQRQRIVPRHMLGRVTGTVRMLFLAASPLGVTLAGLATAALGGDPRPVFLGAGVVVIAAAAAGWIGARPGA